MLKAIEKEQFHKAWKGTQNVFVQKLMTYIKCKGENCHKGLHLPQSINVMLITVKRCVTREKFEKAD